MNIKFELVNVYLGWEDVSLPDDLKIRVKTENTTHEMSAALRELLRLFHYASNRKTCDLPIGTGKSVHIDIENDHIRFRKPPLDVVTTYSEVEDSLRKLITEVFKQKDKMSDDTIRNEQFEYLRGYLTEKNEMVDVKDLYRQSMK